MIFLVILIYHHQISDEDICSSFEFDDNQRRRRYEKTIDYSLDLLFEMNYVDENEHSEEKVVGGGNNCCCNARPARCCGGDGRAREKFVQLVAVAVVVTVGILVKLIA